MARGIRATFSQDLLNQLKRTVNDLPRDIFGKLGRKIFKQVLNPYAKELENTINTLFKKHTGRLSRGVGKTIKFVSKNVTIDGQYSTERVLGSYYVAKQEDVPVKNVRINQKTGKAIGRQFIPNTCNYVGWLEYGTEPHYIGRGSVSIKTFKNKTEYIGRMENKAQLKLNILESIEQPTERQLHEIEHLRIQLRQWEFRRNKATRDYKMKKSVSIGALQSITARHFIQPIRERMKREAPQKVMQIVGQEIIKYCKNQKSVFKIS